MPVTKEVLYLTLGEGLIDPARRVAAGEISETEIEQFGQDLNSPEFDAEIDALAIPNVCVDGRGLKVGPNAAGATFSLVMADALTTQSYRRAGEDAATHAGTILGELKHVGHEVGGHDDENAHGPFCGCGAQDKLDNLHDETAPSILEYIDRRGDDIRALLESPAIGLTISDEVHATITGRSRELRKERYAANGAAIKAATVAVAGEESIESVRGTHNEVALRIRTMAGKTIDRVKLRQKYGDRLQTFELDLPALRQGVEALSLSKAEADDKFIAALYYNVATASTLSGPSLRVIVY